MAKTKYHRRFYEDQEMNIYVEYKITSSLGPNENDRYSQKIHGRIYEENDNGEEIGVVGKIFAVKLLIGNGLNDGWNPEAVFDTEEYTYELGKLIYDYKASEFNQKVREFYKDSLVSSGVLILQDIEILPNYRGKDIGAYAIKDLFNNFSQDTALFVTDIYPNQFADGIPKDEWYQTMRYDRFNTDFDKSFHKLNDYFHKMGFESIPGIGRKLVFINCENQNDKFDAINFDS